MSRHIIVSDLMIVSYMISRRVPPGQGLGGLVGGLLWALRGEGGDGPQEAPEVRCRARGACRRSRSRMEMPRQWSVTNLTGGIFRLVVGSCELLATAWTARKSWCGFGGRWGRRRKDRRGESLTRSKFKFEKNRFHKKLKRRKNIGGTKWCDRCDRRKQKKRLGGAPGIGSNKKI